MIRRALSAAVLLCLAFCGTAFSQPSPAPSSGLSGWTFGSTSSNYTLTFPGSAAAGNLFITDGTQSGLTGTEDLFIGHGAGGAFTGASSFDTAIGLNNFGIGGGSPSVGTSNTGVGSDCARNVTVPTGQQITNIDCFGAAALRNLGNSTLSSGVANVGAFGNHAFSYLETVGGAGSLAVGAYAAAGASSGLTVGNSTILGPFVAQNATYMNNDLLIGFNIAQTALNDQDVILIGDGYTTVEPPTITTNDYLNFNNLWTATAINTPASANQVFYGDVTSGGGITALATSATTGFDHLPSMAGTPTGTPAVTTSPATVINSTSKAVNFYIGGAWYHVVLVSGAG